MAESRSAEGATARLGEFIAATAARALPPEVADKAGICLLDALGLAGLARRQATVNAMHALATPVAADAGARLWFGAGRRAGLAEAVAANAVAVHALFQDDNDVPSWSHPASLVSPVALTTADAHGASLSAVLRAVATGYAAICWLGAAERVARALIARGIRTSPTLGTIGAAAAAASVLGLPAAQAAHAVGIAASITGGVLEPVGSGSDEWRVQNAHAARGGLLAAQLAGAGTRGAARGLEGKNGIAHAYAGLDDVPEWAVPPDLRSILKVWAKPWATLGDNVPAVAAAHALRRAGVELERIARIDVSIWRHYAEYPGTSYAGPFDSVAQALASTAFAVSAMLALGELHYAVSEQRRGDPAIERLVPRVRITGHDGEWHEATVKLTLDDGRVLSRDCSDGPRALMFQDRATASALAEQRFADAGCAPGAGRAVADAVFAAADGRADMSARELVDRLVAG